MMKVFVWGRVSQASENYHSEGGVVVFADSEERARELANNLPGCNIKETENPDEIREVIEGVEKVFIMPDAVNPPRAGRMPAFTRAAIH